MKQNNKKFNSEIAEILGAFIGDGWIESDKDALYITGSPIEDKLYYDKHLAPLFSRKFITVKPKNFQYWGVYGIVTYKKEAIQKALRLGFKPGHKALKAEIPEEIMLSTFETKKAVLRGIFDTDGSFWCEKSTSKTSIEWKRTHNHHPELRISSCSRKLLEQIRELLNAFEIKSEIVQKNRKGFKNNRNIHDSFALNIRRKDQIEKWFEVIGTNNPRHQTRYAVWKKLGYLPPKTNINERISLLQSSQ